MTPEERAAKAYNRYVAEFPRGEHGVILDPPSLRKQLLLAKAFLTIADEEIQG